MIKSTRSEFKMDPEFEQIASNCRAEQRLNAAKLFRQLARHLRAGTKTTTRLSLAAKPAMIPRELIEAAAKGMLNRSRVDKLIYSITLQPRFSLSSGV